MNKYKKRSFKQVILKIIILVILIISITISTLILIDKKIIPYAMVMADNYIKSELNYKISKTVTEVIVESNVKTSDLYSVTTNNEGNIKSIETNTVLVNSICSNIVEELSLEFLNSDIHIIEVPIGIILNVELFSNFGPTYKVKVKPIGVVDVDYNTTFTSAGLNQSNYKLDLNVSSKVQFVNPLRSQVIDVNREVTLINNVINGEVPSGYITR